VKKITIVEINDACKKLIDRIPEVRSVLSNPKIDIIIDDGRRWLNANPNRRFDYFCLNSTFHNINFAGNLLSIDFYKLLKKHMNKGAVVLINPTRGAHAYKTFANSFNYTFVVPEIYGVIMGSQQPFIPRSVNNTRKMMDDLELPKGKPALIHSKAYSEFTANVVNARNITDNYKKSTVIIDGSEIITDDYLPNEYYLIKFLLNGNKYTNFIPVEQNK
jgi:hypothetical protein